MRFWTNTHSYLQFLPQPFYDHYTFSWHSLLKTWQFCWSKVLLSAHPCFHYKMMKSSIGNTYHILNKQILGISHIFFCSRVIYCWKLNTFKICDKQGYRRSLQLAWQHIFATPESAQKYISLELLQTIMTKLNNQQETNQKYRYFISVILRRLSLDVW